MRLDNDSDELSAGRLFIHGRLNTRRQEVGAANLVTNRAHHHLLKLDEEGWRRLRHRLDAARRTRDQTVHGGMEYSESRVAAAVSVTRSTVAECLRALLQKPEKVDLTADPPPTGSSSAPGRG